MSNEKSTPAEVPPVTPGKPDILPPHFVQTLSIWMKEVTDLLCVQPGVPNNHKEYVSQALKAFIEGK
jgi:hypothetical protein